MTPQHFEQYCFYRLYSIDLDTVQQSLRMLKRYRRQDTRYVILRDIVIGYARPFSGNTGRFFPKHHLKLKFVPKHLRSLHEELIQARMQTIAHTDYEFRNPKVSRWPTKSGPIYAMAFRMDGMAKLDARLKDIEQLVTAVESNLNAAIREIERHTLDYK